MLGIISVNPVEIAKLPGQPGFFCRLGALLFYRPRLLGGTPVYRRWKYNRVRLGCGYSRQGIGERKGILIPTLLFDNLIFLK